MNTNKALTIQEAAKYLSISNQMVYNLINDKKIKAFKIGSATRIMHSDLIDFIEGQKAQFARSGFNGISGVDFFLLVDGLNLTKDDFRLNNISFSLPQEKTLAILGASGSGKTLLLRSIAGLESIESGEIFCGNEKIDHLHPSHRKIGFVFQDYALIPHYNLRKNIEFPLFTKNKKKAYIKDETDKRMEELKIDASYSTDSPYQLPEGIKQLGAIARERNHYFDLFIMDEPMSHMDRDHHQQMRYFIKEIISDLKKTAVISFSDPEDALSVSDYLMIIRDGEIIQYGKTIDVYNSPLNLSVMEITSRNGINKTMIHIENGSIVPFGIRTNQADGKYLFTFRSDEVKPCDDGIKCRITNSHYFDGKNSIIECESNGVEFSIIAEKGEDENISFIPEKPHFFKQ